MRKTESIILWLSLGDIYQNKGEGEIYLPLDGSIERLDRSLRYTGSDVAAITCTSGYSKENPTVMDPMGDRMLSLADQQTRYITENLPQLKNKVLTASTCWGSEIQLIEGIRLILDAQYTRSSDLELVVAAHWTHLLRIWFYMAVNCPRKWEVKLLRSNHVFTKYSIFRELVKTSIDLPGMIFKVLRRKMREGLPKISVDFDLGFVEDPLTA